MLAGDVQDDGQQRSEAKIPLDVEEGVRNPKFHQYSKDKKITQRYLSHASCANASYNRKGHIRIALFIALYFSAGVPIVGACLTLQVLGATKC